jgi:hypothetical protein
MRIIKKIRYVYTVHHTLKDIDKFFPDKKTKKTNWQGVFSFLSGSLLTISESMPFLDTRYNGILHAILSDYKNTKF